MTRTREENAADLMSAATINCPMCNSNQDRETAFIGALGYRMHFRCRNCGWDWHELMPVDYRTIPAN